MTGSRFVAHRTYFGLVDGISGTSSHDHPLRQRSLFVCLLLFVRRQAHIDSTGARPHKENLLQSKIHSSYWYLRYVCTSNPNIAKNYSVAPIVCQDTHLWYCVLQIPLKCPLKSYVKYCGQSSHKEHIPPPICACLELIVVN